MYKIDQLNSLVESIDSEVKNILPADLIDFAKFVKSIETEFKKINDDYTIVLEPHLMKGYEPFVNLELRHNDRKLFNYSTDLSFYENKKKDHAGFRTAEDYSSEDRLDSDVDKKVSFKQDPALFKEVLEDKLIDSFLTNEKSIREMKEARNSLKVKM